MKIHFAEKIFNSKLLFQSYNDVKSCDLLEKVSKEDYVENNSKDFDDLSILFLLTGLLLGGHKIERFKGADVKQKLGYAGVVLATFFMLCELIQKPVLSKIYERKNSRNKEVNDF